MRSLCLSKSDESLDVQADRHKSNEDDTTKRCLVKDHRPRANIQDET